MNAEQMKAAMLTAAYQGKLQTIDYLLSQGAEVNCEIRSPTQASPVKDMLGDRDLSQLEFFLGNFDDIKSLDNKAVSTPLHEAARAGRREAVALLLARGANINTQNTLGDTALHEVARAGHDKLVWLLTNNGAEISTQNTLGDTALHEAVRAGHDKLVGLLTNNGAEINTQNTLGDTVLHEAARAGHDKLVWLLTNNGAEINTQNEYKNTPLHEAAYLGHVSVTKRLLLNKAVVNIENARKSTPLHEAVSGGHTAIVNLLLDQKADFNTHNKLGETPLHDACSRGHKGIVALLLEYGALIEKKNEKGMTPIQSAILTEQEEIVKLLLEQGAVANTFNASDESALKLAIFQGNKKIIHLLLQHGAYSYQDAELDRLLSMYWEDCNNCTEEGLPFYTSLIFAGIRVPVNQKLPSAVQQVKQLTETKMTEWLSPLMLSKKICQAMTPQLLKIFPQILESSTLYSETLQAEIEEKKNRAVQEMQTQDFPRELTALTEKDLIIHSLASNIMENYLLPGRVAWFLMKKIVDDREQCVAFYKELQSNLQTINEASAVNPTKYKPTFI